MKKKNLAPWANVLPQQLDDMLFEKFHGDQERWSAAYNSLPNINDVKANLNSHDLALTSDNITAEQQQKFFVQAEDGIRCLYVTGVQTCALPISSRWTPPDSSVARSRSSSPSRSSRSASGSRTSTTRPRFRPGCSRPRGSTAAASGRRSGGRSEERRVGQERGPWLAPERSELRRA